jgi:hypothetical protein
MHSPFKLGTLRNCSTLQVHLLLHAHATCTAAVAQFPAALAHAHVHAIQFRYTWWCTSCSLHSCCHCCTTTGLVAQLLSTHVTVCYRVSQATSVSKQVSITVKERGLTLNVFLCDVSSAALNLLRSPPLPYSLDAVTSRPCAWHKRHTGAGGGSCAQECVLHMARSCAGGWCFNCMSATSHSWSC